MLIRYCPRCRSEFQMRVLECLDCGGPTEVRDDEVPFEEPEAALLPVRDEEEAEEDHEDDEEGDDEDERDHQPEPAIPLDAEVVSISEGTYFSMIELLDALGEREIPVRIEQGSRPDRVRLVVRAEHAEAANAVVREDYLAGLREEIPEAREGACPACGSDLPADATECPDCGLILSFPAEPGEVDESETPAS